MNRREALQRMGWTVAALALPRYASAIYNTISMDFSRADFGDTFNWGVATAAYQIEGAHNADGKGPSIWDTFVRRKRSIVDGSSGDVSCDFYHRYQADLDLLQSLHFDNFRFSLAWSRLIPDGYGTINPKGIDFYNRIIDACLERNITPWVTLYHWDLPQALEAKGGWTNRDVIAWFTEYTHLCAAKFGDRVQNWMVLNEPMAYTSLGYMTGLHAPGKKGLGNWLPAVHHTCLCQAAGGRVLRESLPNARIGTTFSCSYVSPKNNNTIHANAVASIDAMLNRLFIEPALGLGYPVSDLKVLKRLDRYIKPGDMEQLPFKFDFIGLQNYFPVTAKWSLYPPLLWANEVPPSQRNVPLTDMGWEINPEGMYQIIKQFAQYPIKEIIITENGASFYDSVTNGRVHDAKRTKYYRDYLEQVLRAKQEGVNVSGYFAWTFIDNFEWAAGYRPRFGLVYNDFQSQQRIVKDSGLWFKEFLKK